MQLQIKVNDQGVNRGRQVQVLRLRLGHRQQQPGHRVAQGTDPRRRTPDQEHPDRRGTQPPAGQDPLLGARRGCHPRGHQRLQDQERPEPAPGRRQQRLTTNRRPRPRSQATAPQAENQAENQARGHANKTAPRAVLHLGWGDGTGLRPIPAKGFKPSPRTRPLGQTGRPGRPSARPSIAGAAMTASTTQTDQAADHAGDHHREGRQGDPPDRRRAAAGRRQGPPARGRQGRRGARASTTSST
ncbi:MAG: hypothetical protein KatS3mg103_0379 [Phycisphaerales bacterium]|nr:MAG: hypothetical protein KatS3mg103_0379 [Phycisphaerales bacterium]